MVAMTASAKNLAALALAGRLRRHARRCGNEKGYMPLPGMSRQECARYLRQLANRLSARCVSALAWLDRHNGQAATALAQQKDGADDRS